MADALIGFVVEELASFILDHIKEEVGILAGARGEVDKITATFRKIQAVLEDAENQQVKNNSVKQWLQDMKAAAYEIEDVLDEWKTKILISQMDGDVDSAGFSGSKKKVSSYFLSLFSCFPKVKLHHDTGRKIKELSEKLDRIEEEKAKFSFHLSSKSEEPIERLDTSSLIDISLICGRDLDKKIIVKELLSEISPEQSKAPIISIVGMGGIGKTALAQLVFNDDEVTNHFDKKIWVCVSDPFDLNMLAVKIIEGLGGRIPTTTVRQWETLHHQLCNSLENKKILLVLDDVWLENKVVWEKITFALDGCLTGSRVLVTTRSEVVTVTLSSSYDHNLAVLNDDDCWSLFKKYAFDRREVNNRQRLETIGRQISDKCKGVPLFAKSLGCLMPHKKTVQDWRDVLTSDIWELSNINKDVSAPLLLSYNALPSILRQCFTYCIVFEKDRILKKDIIVKQWMAHGFIRESSTRDMETVGGEYFDILASRSFFQNLETNKDGKIVSCQMHDLVHDFANFVSDKECRILGSVNTEYDSSKTRHLSLTLTIPDNELTSNPLSIQNPNNLRTLLVYAKNRQFSLTITIPNNELTFNPLSIQNPNNLLVSPRCELDITLLHQLKYLRTLSLAKVRIETLPDEIGNLIHLRYLDLLNTALVELPESISNLRNLQTLELNHCDRLRRLPKGLGKLTSLRHLEIYNTRLECLPQGLERLKHLQTLSKFVVSEGGCQLHELGDLNNLHGTLCIQKIKGVSKEVGETKIKDKKHLDCLQLEFEQQNYEGKSNHDTSFLELLDLHPNLEELSISYYGGSTFPTWMERPVNISSLSIYHCRNLALLQSLASFESIEILEIEELDSMVSPMSLFRGIEASTTTIAYPNLKSLGISNMKHWEECEMETIGDTTSIMPHLQKLGIDCCPKLKSLPHQILSHSLTELRIQECPQLTISCLPPLIEVLRLYGDAGSLSTSLPIQNNNTSIKNLVISNSPHSSLPKGVSQLKVLHKLSIGKCNYLTYIVDDLQHLTTLKHLDIYCCPILEGDWSILSHISEIRIDGKRIK